MAIYNQDDSYSYQSTTQLIEQREIIEGELTGIDNRALIILANKTAYLKKNKCFLLNGNTLPDETTADDLVLDSDSVDNTYYINNSSGTIFKLSSIDPVTWDYVYSLNEKQITVQDESIIVENNRIYTTDYTSRIQFIVPSTIKKGSVFEIIGTPNNSWAIVGNFILFEDKRKLISQSSFDSIKLTVVDVITRSPEVIIPKISINYNNTILENIHSYGVFGGGTSGGGISLKTLDYINYDLLNITTDAISRGELTTASRFLSASASIQYTFFYSGYSSSNQNLDFIDYFDNTILSGNASSRGTITLPRKYTASVNSCQYSFCGGGETNTQVADIDYFDNTILSGNAISRGNLTAARYGACGISGIQYGFYCTGSFASSSIIDYIDMTLTSGNAVDRGDYFNGIIYASGLSSIQYGFIIGGLQGGNSKDYVLYLDLTLLTGNALDNNTFCRPRHLHGACSGIQYGVIAGGLTNDTIEYMDMTMLNSNIDDGDDLSVPRNGLAGA